MKLSDKFPKIECQDEHQRSRRLLKAIRRDLLALGRTSDIHLAADGPDDDVQTIIDRIDRFFEWRERQFKRSTAGALIKRWKPAPPVVAKAMRRAVEAFKDS